MRSAIDCCITQLALDYQLTLLHCDRDFDAIQHIRPLQATYLSKLSA